MSLQKDVKPPHVEDYFFEANDMVRISPFHGKEELDENKALAYFIYEKLGVKVYLLPCLDPKNPKKAALRTTLLPSGVFDGKNPDFYIGGKLFDGKSMMNMQKTKDPDKWKEAIENRIKKAKKQADNFVLEVPNFISRKVIHSTIINYLDRSHKDRIILIKWSGRLLMYQKRRTAAK